MDMWKSRFIIKWHNYHSNQDIFEREGSEECRDSWDNRELSRESLGILAFLSTSRVRSCESRNENGVSYTNNSKKFSREVTGRNPHSQFPSSNLQITLSGAQPSHTHMHACTHACACTHKAFTRPLAKRAIQFMLVPTSLLVFAAKGGCFKISYILLMVHFTILPQLVNAFTTDYDLCIPIAGPF